MAAVRKAKNGKYYLYRRTMRPAVRGYVSKANTNKVSKVFSIFKLKNKRLPILYLNWVSFPPEFEGKHVQFAVEVVGEKEKKEDVEDAGGGKQND